MGFSLKNSTVVIMQPGQLRAQSPEEEQSELDMSPEGQKKVKDALQLLRHFIPHKVGRSGVFDFDHIFYPTSLGGTQTRDLANGSAPQTPVPELYGLLPEPHHSLLRGAVRDRGIGLLSCADSTPGRQELMELADTVVQKIDCALEDSPREGLLILIIGNHLVPNAVLLRLAQRERSNWLTDVAITYQPVKGGYVMVRWTEMDKVTGYEWSRSH